MVTNYQGIVIMLPEPKAVPARPPAPPPNAVWPKLKPGCVVPVPNGFAPNPPKPPNPIYKENELFIKQKTYFHKHTYIYKWIWYTQKYMACTYDI